MKVASACIRIFSCAAMMTLSGELYATNGLWLTGYGAKSIGMGGASIAVPHDALAPASNPANIVGMGTRLDVGAGLFNPPRRAFVDARGSFFGDNIGESRSKRDYFLVPNIGFTYKYNDKTTLGITAYGNGLGVFYPNNFYNFNGTASPTLSISLIQLLMPFTVAYQMDDSWSVGASLVFGAQIFEATGFQSFSPVSRDPSNMTDNGKDLAYGAGVRIGITKTAYDGDLRLGAYIASKVNMTEFDKYSGLIAEKGDLDTPASFGIGISYKVTPRILTAFDIVRINWSDIKAFGNRGPELFTGTPLGTASAGGAGQIGADDGMGFGWIDQTVYKLGVSYQYNPTTAYSVGFNYGRTPVQSDQLAFGVIGPAVPERHLSFGYSKKLNGYTMFGGKEAELTISYLHAFKEKLSGLSPLGTRQSDGQTFAGFAEFEMKQNELEISYGLKF